MLQDDIKHPNPYGDAGLHDWWMNTPMRIRQEYYFGFASMEQLNAWLYSQMVREMLHDAGLRIEVYESNDYQLGYAQAVFRKSTAVHVDTLLLTDKYNAPERQDCTPPDEAQGPLAEPVAA